MAEYVFMGAKCEPWVMTGRKADARDSSTKGRVKAAAGCPAPATQIPACYWRTGLLSKVGRDRPGRERRPRLHWRLL